MKTITSVIAAAFCLVAGVVAATETASNITNATTLPEKTTLRQAFQLYHNIVNGGQLDMLEEAIKKQLEEVNLAYTTYKFRNSIMAVNVDISNSCSFLKLSRTVDVQSTKELSEENLFLFFKDLVNTISHRVKAISTTPKGVKSVEDIKKWLISQLTASTEDEIWNTINRDTTYLCFRSLIRTPGNLVKIQNLFNDYTKAKDKIEAAKNPPATPPTPVSPNPSSPSESTTGRQIEPAGDTLPSGSPTAVTNDSPQETTSTSGASQPASDVQTAGQDDTTASPPQPTAPTPAGVPVPPSPEASSASTSAPAAGEQAGPTEQQPQDATSSASAPATGESAAPIAASTTPSSPAATGATGETAQQEGTPQVENLKPAPTGSSASFNGLAVAVLSVLVVSSM